MRICPNCKKENSDDTFWCKHCNSPLIEKTNLSFKKELQTSETNNNIEKKQETTDIQKQNAPNLEIPIEEIPDEIPPDIKKKLTHIVLPIIIVTIVIVALIIFMQGKNTYVDEAEQFFGKWVEQTEGNDYIYFYSNGGNCEYFKNSILYQGFFKLREGNPSKGEPNNKLLVLTLTDNSAGRMYDDYKYTYSFGIDFEGKTTLTITDIDTVDGAEIITFIKSE